MTVDATASRLTPDSRLADPTAAMTPGSNHLHWLVGTDVPVIAPQM